MATSGNASKAIYSGINLVFAWTRTNVDYANLTSTVSWQLQIQNTGSSSSGVILMGQTYNRPSVTVNGQSYQGQNAYIMSAPGYNKTYMSGTTVVKHSGTSTQSFSYSFLWNLAGGCVFNLAGEQVGTAADVSANSTGSLDGIDNTSSLKLSTSSAEIGNSVTITMTYPGSGFYSNLSFVSGNNNISITNNASQSYVWNIPTSVATYFPSTTSMKGKIQADVYSSSGGKVNTATADFEVKVGTTVKPSVSLISLTYQNQFNGITVQNASTATFNISATGIYGSTIKSVTTTVNGQTLNGTTVTTNALGTSGTNNYTITATDSRGGKGTLTGSFNVTPYNLPGIQITDITRVNSDWTVNANGGYAKVTFNYSVTDLNSSNTVLIEGGYKLKSDTSYTWTTLQLWDGSAWQNPGLTGTGVVSWVGGGNLQPDTLYDIVLRITDGLNIAVYSNGGNATTNFVLIDFYSDGTGMSFGQVAQNPGEVETSEVMPWKFVNNGMYFNDCILYDSGWQTLNFTNGFSGDGKWRVFMGIIYINLESVQAPALGGNSSTIMASDLDEVEEGFTFVVQSNGTACNAEVDTSGNLTFYTPVAINSGDYFPVQVLPQ